jgi:hypothetical protein
MWLVPVVYSEKGLQRQKPPPQFGVPIKFINLAFGLLVRVPIIGKLQYGGGIILFHPEQNGTSVKSQSIKNQYFINCSYLHAFG